MKYSSDLSVLRRILFAAVHLPSDMPKYWETIAEFSSGRTTITPAQVKIFVENMQVLNQSAFSTDIEVQKELYTNNNISMKPVGIVLVSPKKKCIEC